MRKKLILVLFGLGFFLHAYSQTLPQIPPSKPSLRAIVQDPTLKNEIIVTWDPPMPYNNYGYRIVYSKKSSPTISDSVFVNKDADTDTLRGLTYGETYTVKMHTVGIDSISKLPLYSFWTKEVVVYIKMAPPQKPSNVVVSQDPTLSNKMIVKWDSPVNVTNVSGYRIFYSYLSNGATKTDSIDVGLKNQDTVKNLNYNLAYSIAVRAYGTDGVNLKGSLSEKTTPVSITLVQFKPLIIANDEPKTTPTSVTLLIADPNSTTVKYFVNVILGTDTVSKYYVPKDSITNFKINYLTPNTTYKIGIQPVKDSIIGPMSNIITVKTLKKLPPIPTLVNVLNCPNKTTFNLSVANSLVDVEYYIIQKSTNGIDYTTIGVPLGADTKTWIDSDLHSGTTSYYRAVSGNTTGTTIGNAIKITALLNVAPEEAKNLIADKVKKWDNFLTFNWQNGNQDWTCRTNVRGSILVQIMKNNLGNFVDYKTLGANETTVTVDNLKPSDIVTVKLIMKSDLGFLSNGIMASDTTYGPPNAPKNFTIISNHDVFQNGVFHLNWDKPNKGEDFFIIEKSLDQLNWAHVAKIKSTINSMIDSPIEEGLLFHYRIKAGSSTFGESGYSYIVSGSVTPDRVPNTPIYFKAKNTGTAINLTWEDVSLNENKFIVEKSMDSGVTYTTIASLDRNSASFSDGNILPGKTFLYKVKATNAKGDSQYTPILTVTIPGASAFTNSTLEASVFPNPAISDVTVSILNSVKNDNLKVTIYNQNNTQIFSETISDFNSDSYNIKHKNLSIGINYIVISNNSGSVTKRIIKY